MSFQFPGTENADCESLLLRSPRLIDDPDQWRRRLAVSRGEPAQVAERQLTDGAADGWPGEMQRAAHFEDRGLQRSVPGSGFPVGGERDPRIEHDRGGAVASQERPHDPREGSIRSLILSNTIHGGIAFVASALLGAVSTLP